MVFEIALLYTLLYMKLPCYIRNINWQFCRQALYYPGHLLVTKLLIGDFPKWVF